MIGDNNDVVYHPFLRRGPRCVPHLVQSVPVDKVPRTLWCLDTEFHKWPGHRFPFIALLLINLLRYAVTTCLCSTIVKTFTRIPILRWSIDTIGYMSQRLQSHTRNFTCWGITTSIITGKLLWTTWGLCCGSPVRYITLFKMLVRTFCWCWHFRKWKSVLT